MIKSTIAQTLVPLLAGLLLASQLVLPTEASAAWLLPEGPLTYFRGRILNVDYELER